ncbi:hypothetical protein ACH4OX_27880 [Streptomyces roseolus]|uniref:hypothetical protein n=1 Tax=Streptomyces roseolus TaxID=67358 RepID=UPI0037B210E1
MPLDTSAETALSTAAALSILLLPAADPASATSSSASGETVAEAAEEVKGRPVPVEERTPAEQAMSRSYVTADGLRFDVTEMSVEHHPDRSATLTYRLTVSRRGRPDERWAVALPWHDKSWADVLTSPVPPPDRLDHLVRLVHAPLEEWWDTKAHNRRSAKLGRRLA